MKSRPLISKIRVHNPNKKGSSKANRNYVTYIATREGVSLEKIKDINDLLHLDGAMEKNLREEVVHQEADNKEYVEYMARRPRSQGLFGNIETEDLKAVSSQIASLTKSGRIIYRGIISLSGNDAEILGFRNINAWNDYLREVMPEIAQKLGISSYDHSWVAAFHAEESHPHVHYMLWDNRDRVHSPYIHKVTQQKIRIYLEEKMFNNEYQQAIRMAEKEALDELNNIHNRERKKILEETKVLINEIGYAPGAVYEKLPARTSNAYLKQIADETETLIGMLPGKGRLAYKFLEPTVKAQMDHLVDIVLEKSDIRKSMDSYLDNIRHRHELLGETKTKINSEVGIEEADVRKRIANKILGEIKPFVQLGHGMQKNIDQKLKEKTNNIVADVTEQVVNSQMNAEMPEIAENVEKKGITEQVIDNIAMFEEFVSVYEDITADTVPEAFCDSVAEHQEVFENDYFMEWNDEYKKAMKLLYGKEKDIEKAGGLLEREALKGNALAIYKIASLIERELVDFPPEEAIEYYNESYKAFSYIYTHPSGKKEWQQEYSKCYAAYRLGKLYEQGKGELEVDYEKAKAWYQRAGDYKYPEYSLAKLYLDEKIYVSERMDLSENQEEAFYLMQDSAQKKNPFAEYELANMYEHGIFVKSDPKEAYSWYEKAFENFLKMAQDSTDDALFYRIGDMYLNGKGTPQNAAEGEVYIKKAADLGNESAKVRLAFLYFEKSDMEMKKKAVEMLREMSQKGKVLAQYKLGTIYCNPESGFFDFKMGMQNYIEAANQEHSGAQYKLGCIYAERESGMYNLEKALEYLNKSAEQKNDFARYKLGTLYLDAELPIYNPAKAIKYLELSSEQGNQFAQYKLGSLCADKDSEFYDMKKAIGYLEASATQGNQYAQYKLGAVYADESLSFYDMEKAIKYLELSSEQGNQFAQYRLGSLYADIDSGFYDIGKAINNLKKSSEQGNQFAQSKLGCIYYFGKGVPKNEELGRYWLGKAAEQGDQFAKDVLDNNVVGIDFSYCLIKGVLESLETLNRQAAYANNEYLVHTNSKQAMREKYINRDGEQKKDFELNQ